VLKKFVHNNSIAMFSGSHITIAHHVLRF